MDATTSPLVGIDLGTTNSVVAALIDAKVQVIEEDGESLLPSVVGLGADGKLITGTPARNQLVAFPDRTVSSVKRRMGEAVHLKMGDDEFTPQEISAMILRRLRERAERRLGCAVTRAVITVPAFFDEHQRQATREAGELAGLTVERIINEPTAASLVYHAGQSGRRHLMVYDLGGGTFDCSIVRLEDGVIEVLSSKGDTKLGGDDFDQLLLRHVADQFSSHHGVDLTESAATRWRLLQACERAKRELSSVSSTRVTEEFITEVDGKPVNLDIELQRHHYEALIAPLVDRTISCVDTALSDAQLSPSQIDEMILVGGSSRTPLVQQRLREEFHHEPHWEVNPDLAVALGAATQAAIQSGGSVGPVLVDVATHTLGIEALAPAAFTADLVCVPMIHRNSPLPARYEERFSTCRPGQEMAVIRVFQGESKWPDDNCEIGEFMLDGLQRQSDADGTILVRFELTVDGTLRVTAIEKQTGLSKSLQINNALDHGSDEQREDARNRLDSMFLESDEISDQAPAASGCVDGQVVQRVDSAADPLAGLVSRAQQLRQSANDEDRDDIDALVERLRQAQTEQDTAAIDEITAELEDLLFYIKG